MTPEMRAAGMEEIEVEGHRIAYEHKGEGSPLILLHGWPSNSREWRRQIDALSDEFMVVAWDAPGAGRSADPPETFGLSDYADCLAAFIEAIGLRRPHVAGLSFGGGLALELYGRHPAVPRSLILASAYAGWGGSLPAEIVEQRLELMMRNCDLPHEQWAPAWIETLLTQDASAYMVAELIVIASEFHPAGTRVALRAFAEADLRDVLPRIDVPTLLLYGDKDVRTGPGVWEPLHANIRGSKLALIPGVGHMLDIEAAERFNTEARAFLRAAEA